MTTEASLPASGPFLIWSVGPFRIGLSVGLTRGLWSRSEAPNAAPAAPGAPEWMAGSIVLGGNPYPLIDPSMALGLPPASAGGTALLATTRGGGAALAIPPDSEIGLIEGLGVIALPRGLTRMGDGFFLGVLDAPELDCFILSESAIQRLADAAVGVEPAEFMKVGAR